MTDLRRDVMAGRKSQHYPKGYCFNCEDCFMESGISLVTSGVTALKEAIRCYADAPKLDAAKVRVGFEAHNPTSRPGLASIYSATAQIALYA